MIDKLPYQLTKGVTATQEGLVFTAEHLVESLFVGEWLSHNDWGVSWPDAAERLRYREGMGWCQLSDFEHIYTGDTHVNIVCFPGNYHTGKPALHRLAAILCDDAEAFGILHECVTELGGRHE